GELGSNAIVKINLARRKDRNLWREEVSGFAVEREIAAVGAQVEAPSAGFVIATAQRRRNGAADQRDGVRDAVVQIRLLGHPGWRRLLAGNQVGPGGAKRDPAAVRADVRSQRGDPVGGCDGGAVGMAHQPDAAAVPIPEEDVVSAIPVALPGHHVGRAAEEGDEAPVRADVGSAGRTDHLRGAERAFLREELDTAGEGRDGSEERQNADADEMLSEHARPPGSERERPRSRGEALVLECLGRRLYFTKRHLLDGPRSGMACADPIVRMRQMGYNPVIRFCLDWT